MKISETIVSALIIILIAVTGYSVVANKPVTFGSVGQSGEYTSTTTGSLSRASLAAKSMSVLVSDQAATLGSIVIASTTNAYFTIWNATSTTDVSSTTLVTIGTSTAAGTYTFDAVAQRGLIMERPVNFAGEYVVTFRQR
jgi:hypothetical protein